MTAADQDASPQHEAELETNLARLETLQDQLDGLRSLMLNLIQPLAGSSQRRADEVARGLRDNATIGMKDFKTLRAAWKSQETQDLLNKARQSHSRNHDLSKASSTPLYGWSKST